MLNLVAISDPIIDTHVQIADDCIEACVVQQKDMQLCFDYGQKIPIVDSFQSLGGNAPNVALAIVKLGLKSAILGAVGRDAYGKLAVQELKKNKVDTSCVTLDPKHKTRYSIVLNYRSERTILAYSDEKNYRWPKKFPATTWVYYAGLSKGYEAIQKKLLTHLKKNPGVRLAVNPGSYMLKYALEDLRQIATRADVLIVNLEEAEKIVGIIKDKKSPAALLQALLAHGSKEVVVTDGSLGAWAGDARGIWHLEAFPVPVISKTGAGDAFSAAYLAARTAGHSLPQALQWGTANSSGVIGEHGPHAGLLNVKGIKKMIKKFAAIKATKV